jgi:hypothetical protein
LYEVVAARDANWAARISRLCVPCTGLYGQTARVPLPPDVEAIVATVFGLVGRLGLCKPEPSSCIRDAATKATDATISTRPAGESPPTV